MNDEDFMRLALEQARLGLGKTAPNPPVGAVVAKDGVLLGKGWHRAAGMPHAEREALADAFEKHGSAVVTGSTVYITLEPCSTHGRTPPCTQGLIDAGVARVVFATMDRNPAHAGRANAILTEAGIAVESGLLQSESEKLLRPFFKVRETGLPWVIWKTAMSLDGRLTRPPGGGRWLTSEEARDDVQKLRSSVDAILTSGATVRRDQPALTIRVPEFLEGRQQPWRVVFSDFPETLPADCELFTDAWRDRTLIRPRRDLEASLRRLVREHGVLSCMTEAGGIFSAALFESGLVDEVVVYWAALLCGGSSPALAGAGLPQAIKLQEVDFYSLGDDLRMSGMIVR